MRYLKRLLMFISKMLHVNKRPKITLGKGVIVKRKTP